VYTFHMRKTYTGKFKTTVVLEILKEEKTISEIASQYEVHPNQLSKWRKEAINGLANVLEDGRRKSDKEKEILEKKTQELYTEIGKLTTQLNWLKKKSGIKLEET
jgi:transposase